MAASAIDIEVKGLQELQRKMEQMVADLHGAPVLNAVRDSTLMVQRDAKLNISEPYPAGAVDTGWLRASIWPQVFSGADFVRGVVGSNVTYAPYVEYGTAPHFPPPAALVGWVRRHKFGKAGRELSVAYAIAKKIAERGTPARPYLIPAFQKNEANIRNKFDHAIEVIVNK